MSLRHPVFIFIHVSDTFHAHDISLTRCIHMKMFFDKCLDIYTSLLSCQCMSKETHTYVKRDAYIWMSCAWHDACASYVYIWCRRMSLLTYVKRDADVCQKRCVHKRDGTKYDAYASDVYSSQRHSRTHLFWHMSASLMSKETYVNRDESTWRWETSPLYSLRCTHLMQTYVKRDAFIKEM